MQLLRAIEAAEPREGDMMRSAVSLRAEAMTLQAIGYEIELVRQRLHDLYLPSGQLVACDPLSMPETEAFETILPTGVFSVFATFARLRDEARLALLSIEFGDDEPVTYELLSVPGEERDWEPDLRPGFIVDTSVASIMDVETADLLMDLERYDDAIEEFEKALEQGLRKSRKRGSVPFANIDLAKERNLISVAVQPGSYSSYLARSESGEIVQLLVDFKAVDLRISPSGIGF